MYLLKFYLRDKLEQMKVSKYRARLEHFAMKEIDDKLSFRRGLDHSVEFIIHNGAEIGVIGKIEEI